MKTTDQTLSDQQLFLLAHRRHHHFVHFARIFMLLLFLTVWELFADFHIIDSFFFSSPSRVVACFVRMVSERSLFTHIGITLTETVISFFLVALVSLSVATLLWYSRRLSEILEPFLVVFKNIPKNPHAPHLIVWRRARHRHGYDHRRRHVRRHLRCNHQPLARIFAGRSQKASPDPNARRHQTGLLFQGCPARFHSGHFKQYESQYRAFVSRRRYRRISRCQTRARLSDPLRKPGTAAGYAHYIHPAFVYHCDGALSAAAVCRALL